MAHTSNENICNAGSKMGRSGPDVNGRHEEQSRPCRRLPGKNYHREVGFRQCEEEEQNSKKKKKKEHVEKSSYSEMQSFIHS